MNARHATRFLSALTLALAAAGAVQAAPASGSSDAYDYTFRAAPSTFTDGARGRDAFSDGARSGNFDVYTEGARTLAGLDRSGVSATPGRSRDVYTDGARGRDAFSDGARSGNFDVYTEGALTLAGLDRSGVSATPGRSRDVYTDGARGRDAFTDGARSGNVDVFTEGARTAA